jgi:RimJ/RimL family protein N-acetyltransferase
LKVTIHRATESDAAGISSVIARIAEERIYSAIDRPFTAGEQRDYICSLSAREGIFVGKDEDNQLVGLQTVEAWARSINSMRHVAQLGTFLPKESRRQGIGTALYAHTSAFARAAGYTKFIIQVRAGNAPALAFYEGLRFQRVGRLTQQVIIDGVPDDEVILELFL